MEALVLEYIPDQLKRTYRAFNYVVAYSDAYSNASKGSRAVMDVSPDKKYLASHTRVEDFIYARANEIWSSVGEQIISRNDLATSFRRGMKAGYLWANVELANG